MELSKDGRFMGGTTPTGFTKERVSTGSGKNKSAVSFLVPIPEERALVQKLFRTFLETRSLNPTAVILNEEHTIKKEPHLQFRQLRTFLRIQYTVQLMNRRTSILSIWGQMSTEKRKITMGHMPFRHTIKLIR